MVLPAPLGPIRPYRPRGLERQRELADGLEAAERERQLVGLERGGHRGSSSPGGGTVRAAGSGADFAISQPPANVRQRGAT